MCACEWPRILSMHSACTHMLAQGVIFARCPCPVTHAHTYANATHANCVCLCDLRRQSVRHSDSCVQALMHVAALTARGVAVHSCTHTGMHAASHSLTQQCIQSCCGLLSPQHTLRRREPSCLSALKLQHRQQEQGSLQPATGSDAYATARPVVCSSS